jgi:agmatine deiminase
MTKFSFHENLRMPAEWEKQKSTWIAWPHNKKDWPNKFDFIPEIFAEIISHISKGQKVNILIENNVLKKRAILILKNFKVNFSNIRFSLCKTDRAWLRDSFPIFVKNKNKKILLNWKFNSWAKYKNFKKDNSIINKVKKVLKLQSISPVFNRRKVVLEGGAIDVNGKGTLITTEECLLSKIQQRNSGFKKHDYEKIFFNYFGIRKIIWLKRGIAGDDTHGHIDDLARFVSENTIFLAYERNKKDVNYKILRNNFRILKKLDDFKKLKIIKIPMPKAKYIEGTRVPASYLNFYIANKVILVPTFNDKKDKLVLKMFRKYFKNRKVVPIDCSILIWGFGAIHCMTQQEPK